VEPADGPAVASDEHFGPALVELLRDPARRAEMAARSRPAVIAAHSPAAAARARIDALTKAIRV
jgi:hypothetical protein